MLPSLQLQEMDHITDVNTFSLSTIDYNKIGPLVFGSFGIHVKYGEFHGHEICRISWQ